MAVELVGRDEELASLNAFLDQERTRPGALVLEGEAGIGKSTLWSAGVDAARERGLRVLSTRPAASERGLAHAALGDLLGGVLDDVLPALTPPRRHALEVALLVRDASGPPVDARALGVAVLGALEVLAEDGTFVVAIDDVQWLDASSASALTFALRRLEDAPLLVLLARRTEEGSQPSAVETALGDADVERLRVGPLSVGAIHGLLQARLGRSFPRPTLLRIHRSAGGNAFYALELARPLHDSDVLADPTKPLPVPERLEHLVRTRLQGFDDETRGALVLVSAHAHLTTAQLAEAGFRDTAVEPALAERVVEVAGGSVAFTHPLLASVLYQSLPAAERRRAHRLLAELVEDPVARARHLALSASRPDARIAEVLERAATVANAQGAPIVAAELGEHALRLTAADAHDHRRRRATSTARAHMAAGEVERARALAEDVLARARPGTERAEALLLKGDTEWDELPQVIPYLRAALDEAAEDPALQASIHWRLSLSLRFTEGLAPAEEHARAAVALAEQLDDDALHAETLAGLAIVSFNMGRPDALRIAERSLELAPEDPAQRLQPGFALGHVLLWSRCLDRARSVIEELEREFSERDERYGAGALWYLSLVELHAGRLSLAERYAERAREVSVQYASEAAEAPQNVFPLMLAAANRGRLDRARELAELGWTLSENLGSRLGGNFRGMVGVVELWSGDPTAAVTAFAEAEGSALAAEWGEPTMLWWRGEYAQALLEVERIDEAEAVIGVWEAQAEPLGREWVLAETTRSRGLVAAARGDVDGALDLLERSVARHEAAGDPFGRARSLMALGVVRRRAKQKRAAREAIEAAAVGFEALEAEGWAENARAELGRIGGRTATDDLTPAERRVAALVAAGRTNREVAAALFLGERTIASHLTHIYAKLGVRSRTELARRLE